VFAVPTYAFIGLTLLMFAVAAVKGLHGTLPLAESAAAPVDQTVRTGGVFTHDPAGQGLRIRLHRADRGGGDQQTVCRPSRSRRAATPRSTWC